MGNWASTSPDENSDYTDVLDNLKDRDIDAASLAESPTNTPTGYIRYNRSLNKFQEWSGAAWVDLVLAIAGGGTGASTAANARTALGLGTMATQNSNNVSITGGSISGINFDAGAITSGVLALNRGGTGASLSLGASGTVLMSNGSAVAFLSGANISNLNASNLTSGTVPDARFPSTLPAISAANLTNIPLANGTGLLPGGSLSGGTYSGFITFSGSAITINNALNAGSVSTSTTLSAGTNCGIGGTLTVTSTASFGGAVGISGQLSLGLGISIGNGALNLNLANLTSSATPGSVGVNSPVGYFDIQLQGVTKKVPYFDP